MVHVYKIYILCDIDLRLVLMIIGCLYSNIFILYLEHAVETTMTWYIVFRG
jgi:hypothetical protein